MYLRACRTRITVGDSGLRCVLSFLTVSLVLLRLLSNCMLLSYLCNRGCRLPLVEFTYLVFTRMPGESTEDVPLVEFMYFVFTRMPGESTEDVPLVEFTYLVFTRMPGESTEDVPLVEFTYLVFTRMPGESYRRRLRSLLLYLCYIFRALITSLVC